MKTGVRGSTGATCSALAEKIGARLAQERDAQVRAYLCGQRIAAPENAPVLLVISPDGGRVQMQESDPETKSRWREDKVATITSYIPGDGNEIKPQPLVTTHTATMEKCGAFGPMVRAEAAHRGYAHATQAIAIADCSEWIDALLEREFPGIERIADFAHAEEYLHEAGRAAFGAETAEAKAFSEQCVGLLYDGLVEKVLEALREQCGRLGQPRKNDGAQHPRRKLATALGYIEKNKHHMDYARYRKNGWPIGSGNVGSGREAIQQAGEGDGTILELSRRGSGAESARAAAVAGREVAGVLAEPTGLSEKGRLTCPAP